MPRTLTPAVLSALESGNVRPAFLVSAHLATGQINVWTGRGSTFIGGIEYLGIGTFGTISTIEEGSNVEAKGVTLSVSGLDPTLLNDVLYNWKLGLPVTVLLALLEDNGAIIPDPITSFAGRMDQPALTVDGKSATISINCESRLMDMNTPAERRYTNEDQQLDFPGDLGLAFVNAIQDVSIFWGRHPSSQNNFTTQGTSG